MAKTKKSRHSVRRKSGIMGRSDIPYAQRVALKQRNDIAVNREHSAKITLYCMSVAMHEIKGIGYKRLVRFSQRYKEYENEFYLDVELGMAHAKSRMDQMGMPISGEFFKEKVDGLTHRKQEVHDNALQAIQVALTIGAIAMNDEFGFGQEVQTKISERVTELSDRYSKEGEKFLLEEMEKIGFPVINGTVMAYTDEDGNAVLPSKAQERRNEP